LRSGGSQGTVEDFWALRDISFDVQPGEVMGIIGRNGAGKSTLLKILSRITKPTVGHVALRGRIGSLLEVGTGFHPELTGRENIYMNAAILGMSRRETRRNFDDIVAFAEVEKFLDTPVKRYSSGMYVRLAFAVAAYLEPEILIVDEVLAVGDIAFQRKCLGRMREVSQKGRTVLFVSHNMAAIESLCEKAVLLDEGRVELMAGVDEVVRAYCRKALGGQSTLAVSLVGLGGPKRGQRAFHTATLLDDSGEPIDYLPLGGDFCLRIGLEVAQAVDYPTFGIGFDDTLGQRV
jgi:lipopolysaccharide transport system ATP-binding protein